VDRLQPKDGKTLSPIGTSFDPSARQIPSAFHKRIAYTVTNASERLALDLVRREPGITRAEIGRRIGLTGMSMTRIIDGLEQRGLVRSMGRTGSGRGPKIGIELEAKAAFSIGLSIKADALSLILVDFAGEILAQAHHPSSAKQVTMTISTISAHIETFISNSVPDRAKLFGIGIAITGFFIGSGSQVNPPAQLDELALRDIDSELSARLNLPVWIDNDGNAAAEAEAMLGVGRWTQNFAYLYFSTGFGGGIIYNGVLLRGRNGNAGEFAGTIPLEGFFHPNLENLRLLQNSEGSSFETVTHMLDEFDVNWTSVETWLALSAPALNIAVSAASAVLDPDAIVLGGQLPVTLAQRMIPLIRFSSAPRRGYIRPVPVVVHAEITKDPALIGAAALPLRAHFFGSAGS
jgi:predicted NBD/HSP70 family sugar kinase